MNKFPYIILLLITIITINIYSYAYHHKFYPSVYELLANPKEYDGKLVEYKDGNIIGYHIPSNEFIYQSGKDTINVKFDGNLQPKKSILGTTTIFGKVNDGYIELIGIHNNNYNFLKYFISLFGVIILLYYLIKEWNYSGLRFHLKW